MPGLTIVCTAMCKAVITQTVKQAFEGMDDAPEISSKVVERLGEDAGDGSYIGVPLVRLIFS